MGSMPEELTVARKDEPVFYKGEAPTKLPPFQLDPIRTPGLFHVDKLRQESADTVSRLLVENHLACHIFLLPENSRCIRYPSPCSATCC